MKSDERRMKSTIYFSLLLMLIIFIGSDCTQQSSSRQPSKSKPKPTQTKKATPSAKPESNTIPITIKGYVIEAAVVADPQRRSLGLMFREDLPMNGGMLFVFPEEQILSFWMKNTPLPLSIAFIDVNGVILNIEKMMPYDDVTHHQSIAPAFFALEVHQGWFTERGIKAGDAVDFQLPRNLDIW